LVAALAAALGAGYLIADWGGSSSTTTTSAARPFADDFEGATGDLNNRMVPNSTGQRWKVESGQFSLASGVATAKPDAGQPAIAVIDGQTRVESVSVVFAQVEQGCGLVFRYADSKNYWELIASTAYGTWSLNKVLDGEATQVTTTGFSGGSTIEVVFVGATIQLWVDGLLRTTVRDATLSGDSTIGIKVVADGRDASVGQVIVNGQ